MDWERLDPRTSYPPEQSLSRVTESVSNGSRFNPPHLQVLRTRRSSRSLSRGLWVLVGMLVFTFFCFFLAFPFKTAVAAPFTERTSNNTVSSYASLVLIPSTILKLSTVPTKDILQHSHWHCCRANPTEWECGALRSSVRDSFEMGYSCRSDIMAYAVSLLSGLFKQLGGMLD